jgi:hypothetical protein
LGGHSGDQICAGLLGREPHLSSINERPGAKAAFLADQHSGALQAAEKGCFLEKWPERHPEGAKAHHCFVAFTARLKSCPDASEPFIEFFRCLFRPLNSMAE